MKKRHLVWFPGAIYYVTCYGTWNEDIFYDERDFIHFLSSIEYVRHQYPFYLHSYCLISNRIYLLIETIHVSLQDVLTAIHHEYTQYFKRKYTFLPQITPQHHSTLIDSVATFLTASKDTHLAPTLKKLPVKNYRWSSYSSFINQIPNDHVVTSRILAYFHAPKMNNYARFVEGETSEANFLIKELNYEPSNLNRKISERP